jgi:hypothetical protein
MTRANILRIDELLPKESGDYGFAHDAAADKREMQVF